MRSFNPSLSDTTPVQTHIPALDLMRGLCMILVVFQHQYRGLVNAGIVTGGDIFRFVDTFIYLFHVPAFFLISGIISGLRDGQKRPFFKGLLLDVALPYFVWSVAQSLLMMLAGGLANRSREGDQLVWIALYPVDQFWFLYALFFAALIDACVLRSLAPMSRRWILAGLAALVWTSSTAFGSPWPPLEQIAMGVFYLMLGGGLVSILPIHEALQKRDKMLAFLALGVLLSCTLLCLLTNLRPIWLVPGALAGSWLLWCLAKNVVDHKNIFARFLVLCGRNSLAIFVVHTIAGATFRIILAKGMAIKTGVFASALHLLGGTVFALLVPLGMLWLLERFSLNARLIALPPFKRGNLRSASFSAKAVSPFPDRTKS
jgi:fucose 4-O-acetylase-like acetyltransferase